MPALQPAGHEATGAAAAAAVTAAVLVLLVVVVVGVSDWVRGRQGQRPPAARQLAGRRSLRSPSTLPHPAAHRPGGDAATLTR